MFVEISRDAFEKMKKHLQEMGIAFEVSDCTLPGEKAAQVHLEVGALSQEQIYEMNNLIDYIYGKNTLERDLNGNGLPDYLEGEAPVIVEKRERKWDKRMHTLGEEAVGAFLGKNTEEEVTYESQ